MAANGTKPEPRCDWYAILDEQGNLSHCAPLLDYNEVGTRLGREGTIGPKVSDLLEDYKRWEWMEEHGFAAELRTYIDSEIEASRPPLSGDR